MRIRIFRSYDKRTLYFALLFVVLCLSIVAPLSFRFRKAETSSDVWSEQVKLETEHLHPKQLSINYTGTNYVSFTHARSRGALKGYVFARGNGISELVRLENNQATVLHVFSERVHSIHRTWNGSLVVVTKDAYDIADNSTEAHLYLSTDGGSSFVLSKTFGVGVCPRHWSLDSDSDNTIYVGEYGNKYLSSGRPLHVWKYNGTWHIIYTAPNQTGIHIHLVAVDPYTGYLWISYGDVKQALLYSTDRGETWITVNDEWQPVSIAFTSDAIYFGQDEEEGVIVRYDRSSGQFEEVLNLYRETDHVFGGPVYDMTVGDDEVIYATFRRYSWHEHRPCICASPDGYNWYLIWNGTNAEYGHNTIGGPDSHGLIYFTGHTFKDVSSDELRNPTSLDWTEQLLLFISHHGTSILIAGVIIVAGIFTGYWIRRTRRHAANTCLVSRSMKWRARN